MDPRRSLAQFWSALFTGGTMMFSRGWGLVDDSWGVFCSQRSLAIYPVISAVSSLLLLLLNLVLLALSGSEQTFTVSPSRNDRLYDLMRGNYLNLPWQTGVVSFALQLAIIVLGTFCSVAFTAAIFARFDGGNMAVSDAFRAAYGRVQAILGYAIISFTIGIVSNFIGGSAGSAGQKLGFGIDLIWWFVAFTVIPVLVVENVGPGEAVKRSGDLLGQTWSLILIGHIRMVVSVVFFGGVIVIIGYLASKFTSVAGLQILSIAFTIGTLLSLLVLGLLFLAVDGIFIAAVYASATGRNMKAPTPAYSGDYDHRAWVRPLDPRWP
jgi:Family of unknown function (DUF6159)